MRIREAEANPKPGPPSFDELLVRVDHALRHLDDRIELNRNPLTRLARVEALARSRYASSIHPRAVALRDLLDATVQAVLSELDKERGLREVREFLALYQSGATVTRASRALGRSREHCSRKVKKKALVLVAEKFVQLAMQRRPLSFPAATLPWESDREDGSTRRAVGRR
ncbi:MAG TPA: hypothetical protein VNN21_01515 [Dehalococcoidia bacterium]|nr:hypothetical protein [Dehalococcoidia bacterium]